MGGAARDALIHCIQGGVFPVRDRDLHEDPSTGDLLPPIAHLEVAAPSGLMRARGDLFRGGQAGPVFFSALFNMHKVLSHRLERQGASFRSHNEDLLSTLIARLPILIQAMTKDPSRPGRTRRPGHQNRDDETNRCESKHAIHFNPV